MVYYGLSTLAQVSIREKETREGKGRDFVSPTDAVSLWPQVRNQNLSVDQKRPGVAGVDMSKKANHIYAIKASLAMPTTTHPWSWSSIGCHVPYFFCSYLLLLKISKKISLIEYVTQLSSIL